MRMISGLNSMPKSSFNLVVDCNKAALVGASDSVAEDSFAASEGMVELSKVESSHFEVLLAKPLL